MINQNEQEIQSIFSIVWVRRKLAMTVAGSVVILGIAYTLFAPAIWEAKSTIVFPVRTPSLLGAGSFEQTGLAATLGGGPTPLKIFAGMLDSERALEIVCKETGVTRRKLMEMVSIQEHGTESSISISARNVDADLAKKIVTSYLGALRTINNTIGKPLVSDDATVLKAQLDTQKVTLANSEKALLAFQQTALTAPSVATAGSGKESSVVPNAGKWGEMLRSLELQLVSLDSSIKDAEHRMNLITTSLKDLPASIPPVEKWRGKLIEQEYEKKIKELTLAPEAPELKKLNEAIAVTKTQLSSELEKYAKAANNGMVDTAGLNRMPTYLTQRVALQAQIEAVSRLAKIAPAESIRLTQLMRDVTTQSAILQQLQAQYQLASLQSERDPNHWTVLDEPRVDDKAVNKSFSKNGILSLIAGCALGSLAAMFAPKRRRKGSELTVEEAISQKAA